MGVKLEGKAAVVTGAASGIGLSITKALLADGVRVVKVDRDETAVTKLADELGDAALPQVTDLLDPQSCDAIDVFHCGTFCHSCGARLFGVEMGHHEFRANDAAAVDDTWYPRWSDFPPTCYFSAFVRLGTRAASANKGRRRLDGDAGSVRCDDVYADTSAKCDHSRYDCPAV